MSTVSLVATIERFAQLCAALDEGFTRPAAVFSGAGLDATTWHEARSRWGAELAAGTAPDLAVRFGRAYACARQGLVANKADGTIAETAPRHAPIDVDVTAEVPIFRAGTAVPFAAARAVPDAAGSRPIDHRPSAPIVPPCAGTDPTETTLDAPIFRPRPALPFAAAPELPAPDQQARPALPGIVDPTGATVAVPPPGGALPFSPPNGRSQRLQWFDTQTGQRLPAPIWADDPAPPSART
jgi:hypothetical protein